MRITSLESQRGQTLPFWVIGVLVSLSLLFFLANYANAIAWQVRAQNAADSAASGALSVQANVFNEYSVLLYAASVDEYRARVLNQALLNTLYGQGGCTGAGSPSGSCAQDYQTLLAEYDQAVAGFTGDIHLMDQANNVTQAGQTTDQQKALASLGAMGCSQSGGTDYACSFKVTPLSTIAYNGNGNGGGNGDYIGPGDNEIDVIACKNIYYFGSGLLGISFPSYKVIGRAAAAVMPAYQEWFNPGNTTNPQTGQPYQPTETQWAADASPAYQVNFGGLTTHLFWYQAGAIHPFTDASQSTYQCS